MIDNIIAAIGGAAVALGIAAILLRTMIKHLLNKETIRYTTGLEQKTEVLKTELSIYAHEQNIGLTRIDQQRAEAIQNIYGLITSLQNDLIDITAPNLVERENDEAVLAHYYNISIRLAGGQEKLSMLVQHNAIFFDQKSFDKIANYGLAMSDAIIDFHGDTFASDRYQQDPNTSSTLKHFEDRRKLLRQEIHDSDFNDAQTVLLEEFRHLMKAKRLPGQDTLVL